jgi:hypothetical protein
VKQPGQAAALVLTFDFPALNSQLYGPRRSATSRASYSAQTVSHKVYVQASIPHWQSSFSDSCHSAKTFRQCLCGRVILKAAADRLSELSVTVSSATAIYAPTIFNLSFMAVPGGRLVYFLSSIQLLANSSIIRTPTLTTLQPGMLKGVSSRT